MAFIAAQNCIIIQKERFVFQYLLFCILKIQEIQERVSAINVSRVVLVIVLVVKRFLVLLLSELSHSTNQFLGAGFSEVQRNLLVRLNSNRFWNLLLSLLLRSDHQVTCTLVYKPIQCQKLVSALDEINFSWHITFTFIVKIENKSSIPN